MEDAEQDRLIINAATRLFAQLGFDGTSLRLIADTAGVGMAELTERFGDKAEVYRRVMRYAYESEQAALTAAAASFSPTRQGVLDIVDAYLDFQVEHPWITSLWMQRWIGDAADILGPEENTRELSVMMASAVREVTAPGIDTEYMIWTIVWCVHGFLTGGIQHPGPHSYHARGEPLGAEALNRFRAHLHALITRLTVPPADA